MRRRGAGGRFPDPAGCGPIRFSGEARVVSRPLARRNEFSLPASKSRSSIRRAAREVDRAIGWLDVNWRGGVFVPDELLPLVAVG